VPTALETTTVSLSSPSSCLGGSGVLGTLGVEEASGVETGGSSTGIGAGSVTGAGGASVTASRYQAAANPSRP